MGNLIVAKEIAGASVYGVRQMEYTVDGLAHQDFASALTAAAFRQSVAIENSAAAYAVVVQQRQRKVDDLGYALSILAKAIATMSVKNQESTDKSESDDELKTASAMVAAYGVSMSLTDGNKITRGNALKSQNDIQYALDTENNSLQQDMVSLQSLMSKRDNAFSTASSVVKKSLNASGGTINNIG